MNILRLPCVVLVLSLLTTLAFGRKWTDVSGEYSTEADFVEVKDGNAVLKKADGKIISVPLEKLSAMDRKYIQSITKPKKTEPKKLQPKPSSLTVHRDGETTFVVDAGSGILPPFVAFGFFSTVPEPKQVEAGMDYMKERFVNLATTKVAVGNDPNQKMSGLEIMEFVGGFAAQNENTSLTIAPFHGAGNKSGHYGLTGDFFYIKPDNVAFVLLFCKEIEKKATKYQFNLDGLNLTDDVLQSIRKSKGILILTCDHQGKIGPSGQHLEK